MCVCYVSGGNQRGRTSDDGSGVPHYGSRYVADFCAAFFRRDGVRGEPSVRPFYRVSGSLVCGL